MRERWRAVLGATLVAALAIMGAVPLARRAVLAAGSRALLMATGPFAPSVSGFGDLPQPTTVKAADGSVLTVFNGAERREPVRLRSLPPHVTRAVLAAEDARFYHHGGVDPAAVLRAVVRNAQGQEQGGSTITQQLAKINYTGSRRTMLRKFREVQYAVALERRYSKGQLLERYVNQVYFGEGAYGVAAAARTFFGVEPERLTPAQAALLAGKIRSPEGLDPRRDPARTAVRRDQVLQNMRRHHWLDERALRDALGSPVELAPPRPEEKPAIAPHFVELVKREAGRLDELGAAPAARNRRLLTGGYTVETTLDPRAYDAAVAAVKANLGRPGDPSAAVVTVKPGDGAITGLLGGLDPARKFDLASQGRRQPGSAFKPLVYLAALRDGIDPRSRIDSTAPKRLTYKGERYVVKNTTDGESRGPVTIDQALVRSINTVFAQLVLEVGPENVMRVADSLGVAEVERNVGAQPAIALGGLHRGVTPLEMAAAYAAFAAKGVYAEPYSIARIVDRRGQTIYERTPRTRQVFQGKEVGVLNAALEQVIERGTAQAASIGRAAAGKTGTTSDYRDAWFVGYTPQAATAVWVGYPDTAIEMRNVHGIRVYGGTFPAMIWADYMRPLMAGLPVQDLYTADPDALSLHVLGSISGVTDRPPPVTVLTGPESTTTSSSTTEAPAASTTTTTGAPPDGGGAASTSTSAPSTSTTSTTAATTTTARPTTTTTTTTTTKS